MVADRKLSVPGLPSTARRAPRWRAIHGLGNGSPLRPHASRRCSWRSGCALLLAGALLGGCVTPEPPLYRWGEYEDIVYRSYRNPGESDPVNDAIALEEDIARTEAEGAEIPPGVRVHLGYLYAQQGRLDEARLLFEREREVFPESTVFVDGLLRRMGGS